MNQDKFDLNTLVEEVTKYKKYKKKYEYFNKLSKIKWFGKLFYKKRDKFFSKFAMSMACLENEYLPYINSKKFAYDTIDI